MSDARHVALYLSRFVRPGTVTELRALGGKNLHGFFDHDNLDLMAKCAVELQENSKGVYFIPNPVNKPATNVIVPTKSGAGASDVDIIDRRWLLVDIDPVRPADTSATKEESNEAWKVAMVCYQVLHDAGIRAPIIGFSGNGWHLNYPIEMPNDDASRILIQSLLSGLNYRIGTDRAKVDLKTFNASRIWKLYGTLARKGVETEDRLHRESYIVTRQLEGIETAPDDPAELEEIATGNTAAIPELLSLWHAQDAARSKIESDNSASDSIRRAKAYLSRMDPAVSGQNGHDVCFRAACVCVEGFDLSEDEALEALQEWNSRCVPPWNERELRHKVKSAGKVATNRGYLLNEDRHQDSPVLDSEKISDVVIEPYATAATLIKLDKTTRWVWQGWIQSGSTTCLAAEPGVGKTRFCMDLARRIYHGLPWPDGTEMDPELKGRCTLWMPADGQYSEIADIPRQMQFPPESVYLNAFESNPYIGTSIDETAQLNAFEKCIETVKPALVIIDTIGMATQKNTTRPEDAQQVFKPINTIANKTQTAIILVTHLNKGGEALGRRIIGATRQVIKLSKPETCEENDRRLWVDKTSSKKPAPLRAIMGDHGNEYDNQAPEEAGTVSLGGDEMPLPRCMAWLRDMLEERDIDQASVYRDGKKLHGFTSNVVSNAINKLPIEKYKQADGNTILSLRQEV